MQTNREKCTNVNKLYEWLQEIQLLLIQDLNIFFIVKLPLTSDKRVFHFKTPNEKYVYQNCYNTKMVEQEGWKIDFWYLVSELKKWINFDERYDGALFLRHFKKITRTCSIFHMIYPSEEYSSYPKLVYKCQQIEEHEQACFEEFEEHYWI